MFRLLLIAFLMAAQVSSLSPIVIKGSKFSDASTGDQFFVKGWYRILVVTAFTNRLVGKGFCTFAQIIMDYGLLALMILLDVARTPLTSKI